MRTAALMTLLTLSLLTSPFTQAAETLPPMVDEIRLRVREGKIDDAVDAGQKAVESMATDARAWLWAGRAYGQQAMAASMLMKPKWAGRTRDAYEKAVELDPNLLDARFDLIQYYLMAPEFMGGGRDKADAQVQEIAKRDEALGKVASGQLAMVDKKQDDAEKLFREAVTLAPDNLRAQMALSGYLQGRGRWNDVRALWQQRLATTPDDPMSIYQLGRAAALSGEELESGLAHLDAFIAKGNVPDDLSIGAAHWRRGQVLEKLGRREDAIAALQIASQDPTVAERAEEDLERIEDGG